MLQTEPADKRSQYLSGFELFRVESFDGRLDTTDSCAVGNVRPCDLYNLIGLTEGIEDHSWLCGMWQVATHHAVADKAVEMFPRSCVKSARKASALCFPRTQLKSGIRRCVCDQWWSSSESNSRSFPEVRAISRSRPLAGSSSSNGRALSRYAGGLCAVSTSRKTSQRSATSLMSSLSSWGAWRIARSFLMHFAACWITPTMVITPVVMENGSIAREVAQLAERREAY